MDKKGADGRRDETQPIKKRRPFVLTIILWVYLLWIILGWARFGAALQNRDLIQNLTSSGLDLYLIAAGLIWGLTGLPVVWGLLARAGWTPIIIRITAVLYPGIYWFERLILWEDGDANRNWPFMLLLTVLWLGLTFGGLQLTRVNQFFNKE